MRYDTTRSIRYPLLDNREQHTDVICKHTQASADTAGRTPANRDSTLRETSCEYEGTEAKSTVNNIIAQLTWCTVNRS